MQREEWWSCCVELGGCGCEIGLGVGSAIGVERLCSIRGVEDGECGCELLRVEDEQAGERLYVCRAESGSSFGLVERDGWFFLEEPNNPW